LQVHMRASLGLFRRLIGTNLAGLKLMNKIAEERKEDKMVIPDAPKALVENIVSMPGIPMDVLKKKNKGKKRKVQSVEQS